MTEEFAPPGKGGWKRLGDHFPGALTAEYQRLYTETCPAGMGSYMARYGVLAGGLDVAFVHGHLYITPVPLAGPREMRRPPPAAAVWLLSRLHPAFRRRTKAARWALAERPWRAAAERWFATERKEWIDRNQALEDEDPSALDDADLRDHLARARANVAAGYLRHFELHGDDLLPLGLLLARAAEWGIDAATASGTVAGASPVSSHTDEPAAWQLVTGYDLDSLTWCELGSLPLAQPGGAHGSVDLRALVPADDADELERLVDDARAAVALRDDNGVFTAAWPMGLLRRAMLEAGRRLPLHDPAHAVELTVDELAHLLASAGADGPSPDEIAARAERRRRDSARVAPGSLGPEFAIPPLSPLPRPLALIGAAQLAAADGMMGDPIGGAIAVGADPYTGRALVVDDPVEAFQLIEPGDVLVTTATSPTWNVALAHAGALVTTTGGLLSHAAVLARELGIPALIGERVVSPGLQTGMVVTVDPRAGTLTVDSG